MLRHLGLIAVCACIVASVGCGGGNVTAPTPPLSPFLQPVAVEFSGRVVNADTGGPVGNVRVSVDWVGDRNDGTNRATPTDTATSAEDGTFTLRLNLQSAWREVSLKFTGPAGYDTTVGNFRAPTGWCFVARLCW